MKRIGILTAGGDTPALNATIHGAVERANELNLEVIGLTEGFRPDVPIHGYWLYLGDLPVLHLMEWSDITEPPTFERG